MSEFWSKRLLKRRLIAGLVVIAPVTVTLAVLWWIFQWLDGLLGQFLYPAIEGLLDYIASVTGWQGIGAVPVLPGIGLIVLLVLLLMIGWLAERTVGGPALGSWHKLLERMPLTRKIYNAVDRIVRAMLGSGERPFKTVVLVEYPSDGRWAIGFLAARAPDAVQPHVPDAVSVFVPTTPNPTSGWLVVVSAERIKPMPMTVDEAFTYILSAGSVRPDGLPSGVELPALADQPAGASATTVRALEAEQDIAEGSVAGVPEDVGDGAAAHASDDATDILTSAADGAPRPSGS